MTKSNVILKSIGRDFGKINSDFKQNFEHGFDPRSTTPSAVITFRRLGEYTDEDQKIMEFLFMNTFATTEQLVDFFAGDKSDDEKVVFVKNLETLVHHKILNRFTLSYLPTNEHTQDMLDVYTLDFGGKYILTNYSDLDTSNWFSTDTSVSGKRVAKKLYVTEFFMAMQRTLLKHDRISNLLYFESNPEFSLSTKRFSADFRSGIESFTGSKDYSIGTVVTPADGELYFTEQLDLLNSLLSTKGWLKYFPQSKTIPALFVIVPYFNTQLNSVISTYANVVGTEPKEDIYFISGKSLPSNDLDDSGVFYRLKFNENNEVSLESVKINTFI